MAPTLSSTDSFLPQWDHLHRGTPRHAQVPNSFNHTTSGSNLHIRAPIEHGVSIYIYATPYGGNTCTPIGATDTPPTTTEIRAPNVPTHTEHCANGDAYQSERQQSDPLPDRANPAWRYGVLPLLNPLPARPQAADVRRSTARVSTPDARITRRRTHRTAYHATTQKATS